MLFLLEVLVLLLHYDGSEILKGFAVTLDGAVSDTNRIVNKLTTT